LEGPGGGTPSGLFALLSDAAGGWGGVAGGVVGCGAGWAWAAGGGGGGGGGVSAFGSVGSSIVTSIACSGTSKFLMVVPHSNKAATRPCSVNAMPAAVGDMCSKRRVVELIAWATVTPFYGAAVLAASLWARTYRRPKKPSVPASH
jgi:hypothetical protein